MLQIKTICKNLTKDFDDAVNAALADGWTLCRRFVLPEGFIAEMEKEIITEAERDCDNCEYRDLDPDRNPCASCNNFSNWTDPNA